MKMNVIPERYEVVVTVDDVIKWIYENVAKEYPDFKISDFDLPRYCELSRSKVNGRVFLTKKSWVERVHGV